MILNPSTTSAPLTIPQVLIEQDTPPTVQEPAKQQQYVRVRETIKTQIESGQYKFGEKIPSIRELTLTFGVSHPTIIRALEELLSQGYIEAISGRGTFVRFQKDKPFATIGGASENSWTPDLRSLSEFGHKIGQCEVLLSGNAGSPSTEHLPVTMWHQALMRQLRNGILSQSPHHTDAQGVNELRNAIAKYLRRTRGIFCDADQVIVTSGASESLSIILRTLIDPLDRVAIEDPSAPIIGDCVAAHRADVIRIPVSIDGISVSKLQETQPRLCIVSPRNNPTGVTLSPGTAYDLLNWADKREVFIVEDNFDNDFHYAGGSAASLITQRKAQRVLVLGSFAKTLHPIVSTSFIVAPNWIAEVLAKTKALTGAPTNYLEQHTLADFLDSGQMELHFRRTRKAYSTKRALLIAALTRAFKHTANFLPTTSGLHITVRFSELIEQDRLLQAAKSAGLPIQSTAPFYTTAPLNEYTIGFAQMHEDQIFDIVTAFAKHF